jgi:hypothetical protein
MKLLEPVMWNSMKLTHATSDPMISLVPACYLLSMPEIQQQLILPLLCTISKQCVRLYAQKKLRVQEDNNGFWLWVAKRKPKGKNFTKPYTPKKKTYMKNCNCCGSLKQELILP